MDMQPVERTRDLRGSPLRDNLLKEERENNRTMAKSTFYSIHPLLRNPSICWVGVIPQRALALICSNKKHIHPAELPPSNAVPELRDAFVRAVGLGVLGEA